MARRTSFGDNYIKWSTSGISGPEHVLPKKCNAQLVSDFLREQHYRFAQTLFAFRSSHHPPAVRQPILGCW